MISHTHSSPPLSPLTRLRSTNTRNFYGRRITTTTPWKPRRRSKTTTYTTYGHIPGSIIATQLPDRPYLHTQLPDIGGKHCSPRKKHNSNRTRRQWTGRRTRDSPTLHSTEKRTRFLQVGAGTRDQAPLVVSVVEADTPGVHKLRNQFRWIHFDVMILALLAHRLCPI